jgi:hypothetical protein
MSSPVTAGQKLFGTYSLWKNETSKLVAAKEKPSEVRSDIL